jgi:hypothetical protein
MDESLYLRIKQYKNGQLTEAERAAFEQQMQTDPAFADEVATWAAIFQGIQEKGDAQLNNELMDFGKQLLQASVAAPEMTAKVNPELMARRFSIPRWAYAAAAMILLLLVAWPIYQRFGSTENTFASAETLFSEHFSALDAPTVRDGGAIPWQVAYQQQQYAEAAAALQHLLEDPNYKRRSEAQLFLGISHLGTGQPQKALEVLQQVNPDNFEWEEAQWYTMLAYLKLGNTAKAKNLLQTIATQTGNARQQAASILLKQIK